MYSFRLKCSYFFWLTFITSLTLSAQSTAIFLDEDFSDWQQVPVAYTDAAGDNGSDAIDFGKCWVTHDASNLYFRIEVGETINLQENNNITLYLDTDTTATTGEAVHGIGAELSFSFGDRSGSLRLGGNSQNIRHADIGMVSSPTVSSSVFELAISRSTMLGNLPLFTQEVLHFALLNDKPNADKLPDVTGGIRYTLGQPVEPHLADYQVKKPLPAQLRMISYNVLRDDLFDADKNDAYRRIFQAVAPDIIGFQEIYNHSSAEAATKVASYLSGTWFHGGVSGDVMVVSRFPVLHSIDIGSNGAFILDLGGVDNQLLLLVAHPPCCGNNMGRQREIDEMMAFVRDAKAGNGFPALLPNTPIVIMGDMNLVGFREQQQTLITGNIMDEGTYGPDFQPDWNGNSFLDAKPPTTHRPMTFTWYREGSNFSPGRLDYIVYTGSVLHLTNSYVLFTRGLPQDSLQRYGLEAEDVIAASDHLPVVADFEQTTTSSLEQGFSPNPLELDITPNPVEHSAKLKYTLSQQTTISLHLTDATGRILNKLDQGKKAKGTHELEVDVQHLAAGMYQVHLVSENGILVKQVVVR